MSAFQDACLPSPRIVCLFLKCLPDCLCCYLTYLLSVCLPARQIEFHLFSVFLCFFLPAISSGCLSPRVVCLFSKTASLIFSVCLSLHTSWLSSCSYLTDCFSLLFHLSDSFFIYVSSLCLCSVCPMPSKTRPLLKNKTSQFGHSMC